MTTSFSAAPAPAVPRPSVRGHLAICRVDHWVKNVFVLPGMVVAWSVTSDPDYATIALRAAIGLLATCLVASSNYVLNELLDAPYDRVHPTKALRPVPAGQVHVPLAYAQWLVLMALGVGLAWSVGPALAATLGALWLMGCVYNIPPLRSKDLPYLDVLSEAVNNPLRMLAGWYMVLPETIIPVSLLLSYWMVGCYFMALKRYAELREIGVPATAAAYRKSFRHYTPERLLVSITFYGSAAMLFFGAFIMRYRLELILSFPLVALVMAMYMHVSFKEHSAAQHPEKLHRERGLMLAVVVCAAVLCLCLAVDIPLLYRLFAPTVPVPM